MEPDTHLIEYAGGPRDGDREQLEGIIRPIDIVLGIVGTYWPAARLISRDGHPDAQALVWEIAPGGTRGAPSCATPCSPHCPAGAAA